MSISTGEDKKVLKMMSYWKNAFCFVFWKKRV